MAVLFSQQWCIFKVVTGNGQQCVNQSDWPIPTDKTMLGNSVNLKQTKSQGNGAFVKSSQLSHRMGKLVNLLEGKKATNVVEMLTKKAG